MHTDEIIERLGRQATVVTPLRAPGVRVLLWLIGGAVYLGAVALRVFTSTSAGGPMLGPLFLVQQGAAAATGVAAAYAAFASVVPGISHRVRILPMVTGALWLAALCWGILRDLRMTGTLGITSQTDWPCVVSMAIAGAALWALMVTMLRRGAPLTPRGTAFMGGVAALSVSSIEACVTRPHAFTSTVLVWHGLTLVIFAMIFAATGCHWLHWPASTQTRGLTP